MNAVFTPRRNARAVPDPARRRFLVSTAAAGLWTLGFAPRTGSAQLAAAAASPPVPGFGPWLQLGADGRVTVLTNVSEMGQGTTSVIAQIVAEQLEVPLAAVRVQMAPLAAEYHNRFIQNYATFGSVGFRTSNAVLAPVCAAAREMLVRAAAERWGVAADECRAADAKVTHAASGRTLDYTALIEAASKFTPPEKPAVKPRREWRVLGTSVPRTDQVAKSNGSAVFGIDVAPERVLAASVLHAPTFGGKLVRVDERPALRVPGVRQVVPLPNAVAVVADGYWPAKKGLDALEPRWQGGPHASLDSDAHRRDLLRDAAAGAGAVFPKEFDPRLNAEQTNQALTAATRVIDTTFDVPFLSHAAMEPMNATAQVTPNGATLWLSTQNQLDTQRAVAKALGLKPDQVTVHSQWIGGGFGRRIEHDFALEAALIARELKGPLQGRPVRMIWSRETDLRAGYYRPAAAARVRVALGADGLPLALRADLANPSLLEYSGLTNGPPSEVDWSASMGWLRQSYAIPALHLTWSRVDRGVPCGYWRSVGASQNAFFFECSIDLAARATGIDPVAYRRRLLAEQKRALAFVDALAARAGWDRPSAASRFRGFAMSEANNSISGHMVELSVPAPGRFKLERIVAGIDAGVIANPNAVEAQMMGGTLFGLSAALFDEITFKDGRVQQSNFHDYPLVTLAQTPPLDVVVLANGERAGGVGEEGPPTIGPAIANALLAAGGVPVTRLPLTRAGWRLA